MVGKDAWEIEDYLQRFKTTTGRPVFCSMFDENKSCHTDSYGTCLNHPEFLEAFDASREKYTDEQWLDSCEYWLDNSGAGVPLKIIALFLQREIKKPLTTENQK